MRQRRGLKRPCSSDVPFCDRGKNILALCVLLGFALELFIAFTQPLQTVKLDFPQAQSAWNQLRGYTDYSDSGGGGGGGGSEARGESEYDDDEDDDDDDDEEVILHATAEAIYPIVVHMHGRDELKALIAAIPNRRQQFVEPISTEECPYCQVEMNSHIYEYERRYHEECTFMAEWQATFQENCNSLHELDLAAAEVALLSTQGSWRTVWKTPLEHNKSAILKLLRFERREFTHEALTYHRTDATIMSQLTASSYIVNAFASCGQSVITEFASSGARDFIKDKSATSLERLKMGRDLAKALSALHSIDYPKSSNATLAHNDINVANAVQVDGQLKLNDFNIGIIMKWNKTRPCNAPVRFRAPLWKSPEEIRNSSYIDPAMADVYGLGSLLFQTLTKHQPWTHLEVGGQLTPAIVAQRKLDGHIPYVPSKHVLSNKTALEALYFGTMACFRLDPSERLNSYELSRGFDLVVKAIDKNLKLSRATVEKVSV